MVPSKGCTPLSQVSVVEKSPLAPKDSRTEHAVPELLTCIPPGPWPSLIFLLLPGEASPPPSSREEQERQKGCQRGTGGWHSISGFPEGTQVLSRDSEEVKAKNWGGSRKGFGEG